MKRVILAAFLFVVQLPSDPAVRLRQTTTVIAAGSSTAERRTAITDKLRAIGVDFHVEDFMFGNRTGSNIVANIPAKPESKGLLLGAHYDRVSRGQGAVDNAASCAVLLEMVDRLKAKALTNTAVTVVFFDLEELGLLGSRSYFQTHSASSLPAHAMNFDIFGYGDTFFVTPSIADGPLLTLFKQAASEAGFPVRSIPMSQYPDSDHQAMARAGIETLGVTLIDGPDIDAVLSPSPERARILSLIHTDADTMAQIREKDMAKALPVLESTIRQIDAKP